MNVILHQPWTPDSFLRWVECQEERYEFDGVGPVPMNGGTFRHNLMWQNITVALLSLLSGRGLTVLGAGSGLRTLGNAIRYPDALVTPIRPANTALLIEGVVAAFEVVSPSSERTDRLLKMREYAAVPSLRTYVIVEQSFVGVTVHSRAEAGSPWTTEAIAELDRGVPLPYLGIELPLRAIYNGVEPPS